MSSRSWRNLQRELGGGQSTAPTVASLNGWRRLVRPVGLTVVAALAGGGIAMYAVNRGADAPKPKSESVANTLPQTQTADQRTMEVSVTSNGCRTNLSTYPSGKLLVTINNSNATGLGTVALLQDGMRVAEREGVVPGSSASIAVNLQPGKYLLACPGTAGSQTAVSIVGPKVAGTHDITATLATAGKKYSIYVTRQANEIVRQLDKLAQLEGTNRIYSAQCAYAHARTALDSISQATGIEDLGGEHLSDGWTKLGAPLFYENTTNGFSATNVRLTKVAQQIASGAAQLPFDSVNVSRSANEQIGGIFTAVITGQAEPWSHADLMDINAMVQGSRAATNTLLPALRSIDPNYADRLVAAYDNFDNLIAPYRTKDESTGNFVAYDKLSDTQKKSISHALQAIQVPVSRIPAKLVQS